ncbi:MAG: amidohydrolase family protein [Betaproteobacteria bacterium]|nr:amidohydrolase family protein [Betaproteobacteria bacterium]MBK9609186.1 amidohydrolase family protein [Betaproteobacteria bacterium]
MVLALRQATLPAAMRLSQSCRTAHRDCHVGIAHVIGQLVSMLVAVTLEEALKTYTTAAAFAGFEEHVKGTQEPGKYADPIVCDRDPLDITLQEPRDFRCFATLLNGNLVSGSLDFPPSAASR